MLLVPQANLLIPNDWNADKQGKPPRVLLKEVSSDTEATKKKRYSRKQEHVSKFSLVKGD